MRERRHGGVEKVYEELCSPGTGTDRKKESETPAGIGTTVTGSAPPC